MQGAEPAYRLVRDELRRTPTLLGLDKLLEAQLLEAPLERRRDLELDQGAGQPAHPQPRHVQVRQLRLPRAPVLLALPGLRGVGDLFSAPDRRSEAPSVMQNEEASTA